jgi:hypothetical protein
MADLNDEVNAISSQLNRLNSEFDRYASLTASSSNAIRQQAISYGQQEKSGAAAVESIKNLTRSVGSATSAMYEGQRGATAFNNSMVSMVNAVTNAASAMSLLLPGGPAMKVFRAGLIKAGGSALEFGTELVKTLGTMADSQYDAFSKLSDTGAAASDGMAGVGQSVEKLGLNINKLDNYLGLINNSSKDLALFGDTVFNGRRKFEDLGQSLEGERLNMFKLGMTQDQMNESMMQYVKLQTTSGRAQKMTVDQLAKGAKDYLYEQDALTKLTGLSRKEQMAIREQALSEQRFRAKLDAMRASGDEKQIAAADELEKANVILASQSPELAQGFRDIQSGAITSAAAQKAFVSTNGEIMKSSRDLQNGLANAGQATDKIAVAGGKFATQMNMSAQLGTFEDYAVKYAELKRLELFAAKSQAEKNKIIQAETDKQLGKTVEGQIGDPRLQQYTQLIKDQQQLLIGLQHAVDKGLKVEIFGKDFGNFSTDISIAVQRKFANEVIDLLNAAAGIDARKIGNAPASSTKPPGPAPAPQPVPSAPTTVEKTNKIVDATNAVEQAKINEAAAEKRFKEKKLDVAAAEKKFASLDEATTSQKDLTEANNKLVTASKEQAIALKSLENAVKSRIEAEKKLEAELKAVKPVAPNSKETVLEAPKPDAAAEKAAAEKVAAAEKAAAAKKAADEKAPKSNTTTAVPLTVADLPLAEKMSREQKEAINNILQNTRLPDRVTKNKAGKEVVVPGLPDGQRPVFDLNDPVRGNDTWKDMIKNLSPAQKKGLVDDINKEVEKILNKKAAEKTSAPATPNDLRMNDAAALQPEQIAVNAKNMPTVADLTINSDVATLNSKGMNVTLDNSADVAKMLTETVMSTKTDVVKNDQSIARTSFENSMSDVKTALSNQKDTNEMLLSAIQELIRIQRNSVDVQQKIYNVTA